MSLTGKPAATLAIEITNDGFWPDLTIGDFLNKYRIGSEYADDVISHALTQAVIDVNDALTDIKTELVAVPYATLQAWADVYNIAINGIDLPIFHYENAVFCCAKAWLMQQAITLNRKENAENAAKESSQTEGWWLTKAQKSIDWFFTTLEVDQDGAGVGGLTGAVI